MSSSEFEQARRMVMALSEEERDRLTCEMLDGLDGPPDRRTDQQWAVEIERRIAEIDAGTAELVDAEVVIARLRRRFDIP